MSKHHGSIDSDLVEAGYWASCNCGWKGPTRPTINAATLDLDKHLKEQDENEH